MLKPSYPLLLSSPAPLIAQTRVWAALKWKHSLHPIWTRRFSVSGKSNVANLEMKFPNSPNSPLFPNSPLLLLALLETRVDVDALGGQCIRHRARQSRTSCCTRTVLGTRERALGVHRSAAIVRRRDRSLGRQRRNRGVAASWSAIRRLSRHRDRPICGRENKSELMEILSFFLPQKCSEIICRQVSFFVSVFFFGGVENS